jgi:HEAT repeat protein
MEILADPSPDVRRNAASTLGRIGPAAHAAVLPLRIVLNDRAFEVREAAAQALEQIVQSQ